MISPENSQIEGTMDSVFPQFGNFLDNDVRTIENVNQGQFSSDLGLEQLEWWETQLRKRLPYHPSQALYNNF